MATTAHDHHQEILALQPNLLAWAFGLTRDPLEAQALVQETLALAGRSDHLPPGTMTSQAWVHRLLRERFYSVERQRNYRRQRGSAVELDQLRQRLLADPAQEATDAG